MLLTVALLTSEMRVETRLVRFSFSDGAPHASVALVGAFNEWDRARNPLASRDGVNWSGEASIPVGVYPYLFCVDDSRWLPDPAAATLPDANGNVNSKLVVAPAEYDVLPAARGDGRITRAGLGHVGDETDTIRLDERTVGVSARTRRGDVERLLVRTTAGEFPAVASGGDELYDRWRAEFPLPRDGRYSLIAADGPTRLEVGAYRRAFARLPLPRPPGWVRDAVFYQIFPDRYANGDPSNDGPDVQTWAPPRPPRDAWAATSPGSRRGSVGSPPSARPPST